jgi:pyruvate formate lyase activating enzyme
MMDPSRTPVNTLIRAAEIGQEAGLNYVYAGNLSGQVNEYENTYCPQCRTAVVERYGYTIYSYRLTAQGTCQNCGQAIPGVWTDQPGSVRLGGLGMPRMIYR